MTTILRPATEQDSPQLITLFNAFLFNGPFDSRVTPRRDKSSLTLSKAWVENSFQELVVAEDPSSKEILGFARWFRRETNLVEHPRFTLTKDLFSQCDDPELSLRLFQTKVDAARRIVGEEPHWFLSMLLVSKAHQQQGVGALLLRDGCDKADEDGYAAFVNSTLGSKGLYEGFDFQTIEVSDFDPTIFTYHMKRDARKR